MFENKAKGWHGSYSKVGRDSAEKYPMIILKDKILSNQFKKIKIKDYFNTDDELECDKMAMDFGEDIFSQTYKRKIDRKEKFKNLCASKEEKNMLDEYKYHQIHHKGLYDYNLIIKGQKKYQTNSSVNLPKDDLTTKRVLTGPKWNALTGREKNVLYREHIDLEYYSNFDDIKNEKNIFDMKKQTKRGALPTFYDLRIRIDEPFHKTTNLKKNKKNIYNKLSKTQSGESPKNEKSKISFKKFDEKKENHSLSFAKNISREKYYFLTRDRNEIRPFFIPNYKFVEQRSISKVVYNQKSNKMPQLKRKIGIESNLFFDPYKSIEKINNHTTATSPNLKIMEGREEENKNTQIKLPGHMNNIHNRNSLEIITKKTLQMNNYINREIKNEYSSFNKKSFNSIINHNLLKNGKETDDANYEKITRKMNTNERIKKLMEFYSKNLDDESRYDNFKKIDGITYKSINNKVELNEKEKKLFSLKFDY